MSDKKILIAYYSHSGNTKEAAEKIQTITDGDIFEIQPVNKYSSNYNYWHNSICKHLFIPRQCRNLSSNNDSYFNISIKKG